jgi:hypothetical protein
VVKKGDIFFVYKDFISYDQDDIKAGSKLEFITSDGNFVIMEEVSEKTLIRINHWDIEEVELLTKSEWRELQINKIIDGGR